MDFGVFSFYHEWGLHSDFLHKQMFFLLVFLDS
jgi:hypothetical protein